MNCEVREVDLILDTRGQVVRCSPAATELLDQPVASLLNHPVTTLFPGLPISLNTPGYNVAYAIIHGAQGQWMQHQAQASGGHSIGLEILWSCLKIKEEFFIALNLRETSSHATPDSSANGLAFEPMI